MDPRRFKTLTTSTPSVANPSATFGLPSEASDPSTISGGSLNMGKMTVKHYPVFPKMTTVDWVLKAIETVGVPRKGASYIAILKWIVNNKENVVINRLKTNLRKAIEKALANGLLKRPAISKNVTGLRGYFLRNKDAVTAQEIPQTKPARKLVEITNVTKVVKVKTSAAKAKASVQLKSKSDEQTKPIKLLTKSAKLNLKSDAAGISRRTKTQLKSKAEKHKTDAVEENLKTQTKSAKPTSSKPKIQHKAVTPNPDAEAGPSYEPETQLKSKHDKAKFDDGTGPGNKLKTQPKAKPAKPNLDIISEPGTKPKTRAKARNTKPNIEAESGHSNKLKTQPKLKAKKTNLDANAEPSAKPKTHPKDRTAKPNLDAESGLETQPKDRTAKPNLDAEDEPQTQPESVAFQPNLEKEAGFYTKPIAIAAESSHDVKARPKTRTKARADKTSCEDMVGTKTRPKVRSAKPYLDAETGLETQPKAIANEPKPEAGQSSSLKTTPKTKAAVKPRPGKHPLPALKDILPHQKAASKTLKESQKINPKKLYAPSGELPLNISREEFSDKKLNVKLNRSNVRVHRRNSEASDSEVICHTKVAKATKVAKNFEVKKLNKKETLGAGPSVSRENKQRGKNNIADV